MNTKQNSAKTTYENIQSTYLVDSQTGEVKSEEHHQTKTIRQSKEPNYVKLYLDHLARFKNLQISFNSILNEFLKYTSYANVNDPNGGMLLILNKYLKEQVSKNCGVSLQRVNNAITEFVKKGYMRRIDLGTYQLNPYLFGKGEWTDISNIRATFDYGTGEVIADIVRDEEKQLNTATDEIAKKSYEKLTLLEKKKE